MNLNLSKFKKISENDHSAILQHPSGHKIQIAKKILSPSMKKELDAVPMHLAEGTPDAPIASYDPSLSSSNDQNASSDQSSSDQNASPAPAPAPTVVINNTPPTTQPVAQAAQAPAPAQAQVAQVDPNAAQISPSLSQPNPYSTQNDPYGSQAYGNISKEGLQNVTQGIQGEAQGQIQQNQAEAQIYGSGAQTQQNQINQFQNHLSDLRNEYKNFVSDVQNGMIDPKHYLNSMGTGSKISTAIGLILGGGGAGLSHQQNLASNFLDQQIQNDIQSQTTNLGAKENLLNANIRQYGNERDGAAMTEVMQRGIISNQLMQAALKSGNPLQIARAQKQVGEFELQNNQLMSQIAVRQTLQGGPQAQNQAGQQTGQAASNQIDPATKIRLLGMIGQITPEQTSAAFKELQTNQELMKSRDNALRVFDELNQTNTVGNRLMSPIQTSRQVQAARDNAAVQISKDEAGRVNEFEFNAAKNFFPAPGDTPQTIAKKRADLIGTINKKINSPVLNSIGISPQMNRAYSPQGAPAVAEAPPVLK